MQSLNKNGVSITQTPGEEKFVKFRSGAFKGRTFYQYDYRHTDMALFSTVAKTLDECRRRRDEWIAKKEQCNEK
ncbi:DUF3873 domain-containing protein [Parabacteroides distasonis]|uniref:DUF3873 domain-containing protein n=1 Tax=Parabacteroides distasonis TaxID=823 RepID=UPI00135F3136|nr:DUF3873 domain-containing protein [Parabacteroides distasonis]MRY91161.1 DUF3873 domain-containing protein [Parabacteroides distasonis]